MAIIEKDEYLKVLPLLQKTKERFLWMSYDEEADVLYINFKKPSHATDSKITDDDIIMRYEGKKLLSMTILNAKKREITN